MRSITRFRALFAALAVALVAFMGVAYAAQKIRTFACSGTFPLAGRVDGLCVDADTYGPLLVVNGTPEKGLDSSLYVTVFGDFVGDTVVPPVGTPDGEQGPWVETSTNQTTSVAQKADFDDGALELLTDNGNEVGDITLYWGDESNIDSDTGPFCIFRVQIQTAPAAADSLSWGLMGAQNDIISSTANNAYFSVTGADLNLDVSSDDATTDDADNDTTVDLVADTWYEFLVSANEMHGVSSKESTGCGPDGCSATDIGFFYRSTLGGAWTQLLPGTTFSIGANVALQPFVQVEKTSGTTTPDLLVDYISCTWERS